MNIPISGAAAAATAVPVVLALLGRLFPPTTLAPTGMSIDELTAKYGKWDAITFAVMVILMAPMSLCFWAALKALADWYVSALPPAHVTLAPIVPVYWWLPALFLAFACGTSAAIGFAQWRLGDRYRELLAYWSLTSKMDMVKVNKLVLGSAACLCTVLIFLGLRPFVQLRDNALVVQGFLSFAERRLPLAEIERIKTSGRFVAPDGSVVSRREYMVTLSDHSTWTTFRIASDPDQTAKRALIDELSRRSGVPIEQIDHFAKGEIS
jgi:hypothetical protein